jgi:hypothetical protein
MVQPVQYRLGHDRSARSRHDVAIMPQIPSGFGQNHGILFLRRTTGYLRVRARLTLGLGKRWHAAREIDSRRPWYWFTPQGVGCRPCEAGLMGVRADRQKRYPNTPLWNSESGAFRGPVRRALCRPMVQARGV